MPFITPIIGANASGGVPVIAAPGAGFNIQLKKLIIGSGSASAVVLYWGVTATLCVIVPASGSIEIDFAHEDGGGPDNEALNVVGSTTTYISGTYKII